MNNIKEYDFIEIGKKISSERAGMSLSQEELGKRLNYTRQTIASWEKARSYPTLNDLFKLCKIFNCELSYLLCEADCKTKDIQGIHDYTGLTEAAIKKLSSLEVIGVPDYIVKEILSQIIVSSHFEDLIASYFIQINHADNLMIKRKHFENHMPEFENDVDVLQYGKYDIAEVCTNVLYDIRPINEIVLDARKAIGEYYAEMKQAHDKQNGSVMHDQSREER